MSPFRVIDHTADVAVVIEAKDREALLSEGARVLCHILTGNLKGEVSCEPGGRIAWVRIRIGFKEFDALFIDFLNRVLKTVDIRGVLPVSVFSRIGARRAVVKVGFVKAGRGVIMREIKAATHHNYRVKRTPCGFSTTVTFDV